MIYGIIRAMNYELDRIAKALESIASNIGCIAFVVALPLLASLITGAAFLFVILSRG